MIYLEWLRLILVRVVDYLRRDPIGICSRSIFAFRQARHVVGLKVHWIVGTLSVSKDLG